MSIVDSHYRCGSRISGHYRNGAWVAEHERSGTVVTEYERSGVSHDGWRLVDPGRRLTHPTTCWWCGEEVFFHRNEDGGCVLFDALGRPWPVHECWQIHSRRSEIEAGIHDELDQLGYDGTFAPSRGKRLSRPPGGETWVSVWGYVADNEWDYEPAPLLRLASRGRTLTIELVKVHIWSEGLLFPFLVPTAAAEMIADYAIVQARGKWVRRRQRWHLLPERIREWRDSAIRPLVRLPSPTESCVACGLSLTDNWGLTDKAAMECEACGEMRGGRTYRAFMKHLSRIVSHQY